MGHPSAKLASLQNYVLVSQDCRRIEVFRGPRMSAELGLAKRRARARQWSSTEHRSVSTAVTAERRANQEVSAVIPFRSSARATRRALLFVPGW